MPKWTEVIAGVIEIIAGIALYAIDGRIGFPSFLIMLGGYHIGKGLYKED